MAEKKDNQPQEYEEPTLLDLEDVAGGVLSKDSGCNTSGSCHTGGSAAEVEEA